jgi:putative oxidoreductase
MTISRRIARPLLASMFIAGGLDAIQSPEGKVKAAAAVTDPLKEKVPAIQQDTVTLVKWNGMVQVGAGALLAIGRFRRLAALALIASLIPTTYAGHRFWEEVDDEARARQRIHFLKNLGLLGGLILEAADTEGAPSLGWRAHRRAGQVTTVIGAGRAATGSGASHAAASLSDAGHQVSRQARKAAAKGQAKGLAVGHKADAATRRAGRRANDRARSGASFAAPYVRHAEESARSVARAALEGAEPYVSAGIGRAEDLITKASDHLPG